MSIPPQVQVLDPIEPRAEQGAIYVDSAPTGSNNSIGYGCPCSSSSVLMHSDPVETELSKMVRALYATRIAADDLANFTPEKDLREQARMVGRWANDLGLLGRSMGVVLDLPIQATPPYLPVGMTGAHAGADEVADVSPGQAEQATASSFVPLEAAGGALEAAAAAGVLMTERMGRIWRARTRALSSLSGRTSSGRTGRSSLGRGAEEDFL